MSDIENEARRAERAKIVAWLREEAARGAYGRKISS